MPKSAVTIRYSPDFEANEARIFAGLSVAEFEAMPGTPRWCDEAHPISKSSILAQYQLHILIAAVRDDAERKKKVRR